MYETGGELLDHIENEVRNQVLHFHAPSQVLLGRWERELLDERLGPHEEVDYDVPAAVAADRAVGTLRFVYVDADSFCEVG